MWYGVAEWFRAVTLSAAVNHHTNLEALSMSTHILVCLTPVPHSYSDRPTKPYIKN